MPIREELTVSVEYLLIAFSVDLLVIVDMNLFGTRSSEEFYINRFLVYMIWREWFILVCKNSSICY